MTGEHPEQQERSQKFGAYVESGSGAPGDAGFLNLFWTRVQEPSGTTLMDFELNKSSTACANGVNPVRTAGDLLIEYGSSRVEPSRTYQGSHLDRFGLGPGSWTSPPLLWPRERSTARRFMSGNADGLGALSARTFGEAQLDLDFILDEDSCESFGSAFLKSRSSDSFTSQLKDFIAPVPVQISNCGNVIIHKATVRARIPRTRRSTTPRPGGLDPAPSGSRMVRRRTTVLRSPWAAAA